MADPYLGEIRIFAGNFAPRGWALCNGQLLPIAQNTVLFSLLGTFYGGDGKTIFALPDLRGRLPVQPGQPPSGDVYVLGQQGDGASATPATSGQSLGYLTLNFIIALQGVFPPRS